MEIQKIIDQAEAHIGSAQSNIDNEDVPKTIADLCELRNFLNEQPELEAVAKTSEEETSPDESKDNSDNTK